MRKSKAKFIDMTDEQLLALKEKYKWTIGYYNNRLTVEDIIGRSQCHALYVKARCDCGESLVMQFNGLKTGNVKSCGCLWRERNQEQLKARAYDLTGMEFGDLTAEYKLDDDHLVLNGDGAQWFCSCRCGGSRIAKARALIAGTVKACKRCSNKTRAKDLTGLIVNNIEVIERAGSNKRGSALWKCLCHACGRYYVTSSVVLLHANPFSCGCVSSVGEQKIMQILDKYNVFYVRQKTFPTCKNKIRLRFDVWLPDYGVCIEFDGYQHFHKSNEWDTDEKYNTRKKNDGIKDQWCLDNDIMLIRIPYDQTDNIESILSDWLFLNDAEEANSSSVDLSA